MGQILRMFILNSIDCMRGSIARSLEACAVEQVAWVYILALLLSGYDNIELFNLAVPYLPIHKMGVKIIVSISLGYCED